MKKAWVFLAALLLLIPILFFIVGGLVLNTPPIQAKVIQQIKQGFEGNLDLGAIRLALGVPISLRASDVTYWGPEPRSSKPILQAKELNLRLNPLRLLVGKIHIPSLRVAGAIFHWEWKGEVARPYREITLREVDFELRHLLSKRPVEFSLRRGLLPGGALSKIRGFLKFEALDESGAAVSTKGHLEVADLPVRGVLDQLGFQLGEFLPEGKLTWKADFLWDPKSQVLQAKGAGALRQFFYSLGGDPQVKSAAVDWELEHEIELNQRANQVAFRHFRLASSVGQFGLSGKVGGLPGPSTVDLDLRSEKVNLDQLVQFLEPYKTRIPKELGFSGEGDMTVILRGRPEDLSISGTLELQPSLLTYGGLLTKPRGVPFTLQAKLQLLRNQLLRGDFGVTLKEMVLKGSIVDLDLQSGNGVVTFLTNSFPIQGWSDIVEAFKKYEVNGNIKLLASLEGNLLEGKGIHYTTTLTLSHVNTLIGKALSVEDVEGVIEWSDLRLSSGTAALTLAGSPMEVQFTKGAEATEPWSFSVACSDFDLRNLVLQASEISPGALPQDLLERISSVRDAVVKTFAPRESLKALRAQGTWGSRVLRLQGLQFFLGEGSVSGSGELDFSSEKAPFNVSVDVRGLNLYPHLARLTGQDLVRGKFFLVGRFKGLGDSQEALEKSLRGEGQFRLTEGRFNTFDLLAALSGLSALSALSRLSKGGTEVGDLNGSFFVRRQHVFTEKATLLNPHFTAEASGRFSFRGGLDYDVLISLAPALIGRLPGEALLRIPGRLEGPIEKPRFKISQDLIGTVLGELLRKPAERLLGRPSPTSPPGTTPSTTQLPGPQLEEEKEPDLLQTGVQVLSGLLKKDT